MPASSMQDMYNQSPSGAMSSLGMGQRQQFPYGASYDRRWVFPKMKMRWLARNGPPHTHTSEPGQPMEFQRIARVRWLPSVDDCNRTGEKNLVPRPPSTAVFLLASAQKHKLETCWGWASQGKNLLSQDARARAVTTPRPPPRASTPGSSCDLSASLSPRGRGPGSGATVGCQQAQWQWFLVRSSRCCFFSCFRCEHFKQGGNTLFLNKHLWEKPG